MAFVVANAELFLDDFGHATAGPDLTAEAIRLGTVPEAVGDQRSLPRQQLPGRTGAEAVTQRLGAACFRGGQPSADGRPADVEGLSDVALRPAVPAQIPGTHAPPLTPVLGRGSLTFHTPILRSPEFTFLRNAQ